MKLKIVGAGVVIAMLAGSAWAQTQTPVPQYREEDKAKTQTEINAAKDAERAYNRSLGNIPEQKSTDPWGIVRSDNAAPKNADKKADKAVSKPKPKAAAKADTPTKQ